MIIESKFHDYWDSLARKYHDKTIVFKRHGINLIDKSLPVDLPSTRTGEKTPYYLVFCGQLYPLVYNVGKNGINLFNTQKTSDINPCEDSASYNIEEFKKEIKYNFKFWDNDILDRLEKGLQFNWTDFCIKYKTPTILISPRGSNSGYLELNPRLSVLQFYRVKDINSCFQEISQFISMCLTRPEKEPREITDKDKVKSHGFDRFSFRKDGPPKRKIK